MGIQDQGVCFFLNSMAGPHEAILVSCEAQGESRGGGGRVSLGSSSFSFVLLTFVFLLKKVERGETIASAKCA